MPNSNIQKQLNGLTVNPGVYLFKNDQKTVLYVGKAKKIRNRVQSYFRPNATLDPAKKQMVPKITDIETIICDSENEALILEANLIRKHQPPYNVLLTDDKHYLFIKITKEEYPRVYAVRKISNDKARYFGPYSSGRSVRSTLKLLQRLFPHRAEKDNPKDLHFPHPLFSRDKQFNNLTIEQYQENIHHITHFLQGKRQPIINTLRAGMVKAAQENQFEKAAIFRDQLQNLERLEGNQGVYLPLRESFDAVSLATQDIRSAANVFSIRAGKLLNKNTFLLKHHAETPQTEILSQFIMQYYAQAQDIPRLIILPFKIYNSSFPSYVSAPKPVFKIAHRGKKRHLLNLGEKNAKELLRSETLDFQTDKRSKQAALNLLKITASDSNNMENSRIEVFDISNIQGQLATGSMIVFLNGNPSPKHYRKFRIKTVSGSNDFLMLKEILYRRLKHTDEKWRLPDLIIVDGGKGQLSSAVQAIQEAGKNVPVAAIAKREEELFIPKKPEPVRLPYDSDTLFLIQRMRDEAHRFTITYHRKLRSHNATRSLLDDIPGIGPKTKKKLLNQFGSVSAIRKAEENELSQAIGRSQTKKLLEYL